MTNDARCTRESTSRIAMAKATFKKKKKIGLRCKEETTKMLHLDHIV
jgi:hypothetical protein